MNKKDTKKGNTSTLKVEIPTQLKAQIAEQAKSERRTLTVVVEQAIEKYLTSCQ